jgi:hypothetical protein
MLGVDLASRDVERGEQGGRAMPLIGVGPAGERAPVEQLEIAVCTENLVRVDDVTESPKLAE